MTIDCGICVLRPFAAADAASLRLHADDPAVAMNLRERFPSPYTAADAQAWIARASGERPHANLAITVDGAAVGSIGCEPGFAHTGHAAEVGYWLGSALHGRGIATAALEAFAPYLFETFAFGRLFASVYRSNRASQRVLEKCGWHFEGLLRHAECKRGEMIDLVQYALLPADRFPRPVR